MSVELLNRELTYAVLHAFDRCDSHDMLFWRARPEESARFYAMCNDVFWWATADLEEIAEEDLPLLERCVNDLKELDEGHYLPELYAARRHGMRPQGAWYEACKLGTRLQALFDACGPPRDADVFNPKGR